MSELAINQRQVQKQSQLLSPQMQHSLKMLQVPVLELHALIGQEIQTNPALEESEPIEMEQIEIEPNVDEDAPEPDQELDLESYERLLKLDDQTKDYFNQDNTRGSYSAEAAAKRQHFMESLTAPVSLQEHLRDQLNLLNLPPDEHVMAELIIGCIDEDGFLKTQLKQLSIGGYAEDHLLDLMRQVQDFEPAGVGARDLRECLMIQLRRRGEEDSLAGRIVLNHLQALGSRKFPEIAAAMGVGLEAVTEAAMHIGSLEPKPGREFISESTTYVTPEVFVNREKGDWLITLNDEHIPSLRISRHYRRLMEDPTTPIETKRYINDKIRAGEFLIKSIQQRQDTIRDIVTEIVNCQEEFMFDGVEKLRPLTMAEVASKIGKHETTVSRAIADKYVQTPQGVYELKYFFTPGYKRADGTMCSNEVIKRALQRLVNSECKRSPLSDEALVTALSKEGTKVARRTIAKYRKELNILASHLRREHF